ncbi:MAG: hypothetical protein J5658_03830 [Prevotella sp.]|nr:hypothetical protein [Prevotella sp.]
MTISELLTGLSPYPVADTFLDSISLEVGTDKAVDVSTVDVTTLNRLKARLYFGLATQPNISEGGVSISFTAEDKKAFLALAKRFAHLAGEDGLVPGATYGYKGENL